MLDATRPTTLERLSRAFSASDLTLREGACAIDPVIALGCVGASSGKSASALLRMAFDGDGNAVKAARRAAVAEAQKCAVRWRIPLLKDLLWIADVALAHYAQPICPKCHGQKFRAIKGTPSLSATACPKCKGSGKRPLPLRHNREVGELIARLEQLEQIAEAAVRHRLRHSA